MYLSNNSLSGSINPQIYTDNVCKYFNTTSLPPCNTTYSLYNDNGRLNFNNSGSQVNIGDYLLGGYFGGVINIDSKIYALFLSPKSGEKIQITFKSNPNDKINNKDANSLYDGWSNTAELWNLSSSEYPAAHWVKNNLNNTNFNGKNDWYIPSYAEFEIIYRNLAPIDIVQPISNCPSGMTRVGFNEWAYPCPTNQHTTTKIGTSLPLFTNVGAQALSSGDYPYYVTSSYFFNNNPTMNPSPCSWCSTKALIFYIATYRYYVGSVFYCSPAYCGAYSIPMRSIRKQEINLI